MVTYACAFTLSLSVIFAVWFTVETTIIAPEILLTFFKFLCQNPPSVRIRYLSATICAKVAGGTFLLLNVMEFFCYVVIFLEIHRHHKRHVRLCLSNKPKLAKLKSRQNTITAVGHFTSWAVEILLFGLLQNILTANQESILLHLWSWIIICVFMPSINYFVFPTVQLIASKDLRSHALNLECCIDCCLCLECINIEEEQNFQGVAQGNIQQFQLQVLQNGHAHHM